MNARDAIAIEGYRRRGLRLTLDEWVAAIALIGLAVGLIFGATHPQPTQIASCYQPSEARK